MTESATFVGITRSLLMELADLPATDMKPTIMAYAFASKTISESMVNVLKLWTVEGEKRSIFQPIPVFAKKDSSESMVSAKMFQTVIEMKNSIKTPIPVSVRKTLSELTINA
mgnify:CR=1 FL=1